MTLADISVHAERRVGHASAMSTSHEASRSQACRAAEGPNARTVDTVNTFSYISARKPSSGIKQAGDKVGDAAKDAVDD